MPDTAHRVTAAPTSMPARPLPPVRCRSDQARRLDAAMARPKLQKIRRCRPACIRHQAGRGGNPRQSGPRRWCSCQ